MPTEQEVTATKDWEATVEALSRLPGSPEDKEALARAITNMPVAAREPLRARLAALAKPKVP